MPRKKRERLDPFVITSKDNLVANGIVCAMCKKRLSQYNPETNTHSPTAEELFVMGAVPVPNFGWFRSQECATEYEKAYGVRFQRNSAGKVRYYP